MHEDEHEYFLSYQHNKRYLTLRKPLKVPKDDDVIWNSVLAELKDFVRHENSRVATKSLSWEEAIDFEEDIYELIFGSSNLINIIISNHASQHPITTLVFLDKSARLAAHIFRTLWRNLKKQGKIPQNITKPQIKFIDVGTKSNEKHFAKRPVKLLAEIFSKNDITGTGVLVIDEFTDTNSTIKNAMRLLGKAYEVTPRGLANYRKLPAWYKLNTRKGVTDNKIENHVILKIDLLPDDTFNFLKALIQSAESDNFVFTFLRDATQLDENDFCAKYSTTESNSAFLIRIYRTIKHLNSNISIREIITYFKTHAGFQSLKPESKVARMSNQYRKILTKMVELSSQHIYLEESHSIQ